MASTSIIPIASSDDDLTDDFYDDDEEEEENSNSDDELSYEFLPISCMICMEPKQSSEIFRNKTCTCGQFYCSKCIGKHIAAKIQEKISRVNCPSTKCQGVLKPKLCKKLISKKVFNRWVKALRKSSVVSPSLMCEDDLMTMELAKKNKWQRCPSCKFFVEKREGCLHITCRCKFEFCYGCGAKWTLIHSGCSYQVQ